MKNNVNSLQLLPASYFKAIWNNNLSICGVEERLPLLIGTSVNFKNFEEELNLLGL